MGEREKAVSIASDVGPLEALSQKLKPLYERFLDWPAELVMAGIAGYLSSLSYAPADMDFAIYPGIALLFLVLHRSRPRRYFLTILIYSTVFWLRLIFWAADFFPLGPFFISLALGAELCLFMLMARRIMDGIPERYKSAARLFMFPLAFASYEYFRTLSWIVFPWNPLSTSLVSLSGVAFPFYLTKIFGSYWLTFFLALVSNFLALYVFRKKLSYALSSIALLVLLYCGGIISYSIYGNSVQKNYKIAVVNTGFDPWDPGQTYYSSRFSTIYEIMQRASIKGADLIVLPETCLRGGLGEVLGKDRALYEALGVPFLSGYITRSRDMKDGRWKNRLHNSAVLIHQDATGKLKAEGPYHKMRPVPFGEYVPLLWSSSLFPRKLRPGSGATLAQFVFVKLGEFPAAEEITSSIVVSAFKFPTASKLNTSEPLPEFSNTIKSPLNPVSERYSFPSAFVPFVLRMSKLALKR